MLDHWRVGATEHWTQLYWSIRTILQSIAFIIYSQRIQLHTSRFSLNFRQPIEVLHFWYKPADRLFRWPGAEHHDNTHHVDNNHDDNNHNNNTHDDNNHNNNTHVDNNHDDNNHDDNNHDDQVCQISGAAAAAESKSCLTPPTDTIQIAVYKV